MGHGGEGGVAISASNSGFERLDEVKAPRGVKTHWCWVVFCFPPLNPQSTGYF